MHALQRRGTLYSWYVVGVCMVAYVFSYVDRQIMTLLIQPIQADLGLSDTQFGLLHGLAFALFYATMGIPIAHLSDRHSRPLIIGAGVFLWSAATVGCGFARTFWQLFAARLAVGVGEGALSPATYSMLADYFPRDQLGRAVAVYSTGSFIGAGLAYLGGGAIVSMVSSVDLSHVPLIGQMRPWQLAFVVVGLPGVLVALLCWATVRDAPRREDTRADGDPDADDADGRGVIEFFRTHASALGLHFAGFSFASLALYQLLGWGPAIFIRGFGLTAAQTGYALGIATLIASTAGVLTSGWLNDRLQKRGYLDAPLRTGAVGGAGLVVPVVLLPMADSLPIALALFGVGLFFASFPMPPSTTGIQLLAPNRMRSRLAAMFLFCNSLFGLALGSTIVGALNDYVFQSPAAVAKSVAIVVGSAGVVTVALLAAGFRPYRASVQAVMRAVTNE
jgi:MFS family permease